MIQKKRLVLFLSLAAVIFIALVARWFGFDLRPTPATPTPMPVLTETATSTSAPTLTITHTAAPTATIPTFKAKVSLPSYCRNGPSENYLNATIVPADTEVDVLGRNSDTEDWFMIQGTTLGRCWIPSAFLNYNIDIKNILILTTALTTKDCPCRTYPREGRKAQTNIPFGWRIVINAKSAPNADWLLVTPHDSTEQCWVEKEMLTSFVDGSLPSVALDVLVVSDIPTSTRRPHDENNKPTPIHPSTAHPTSMQPTSILSTPVGPTPVPPTPVPPTPVPPTPVPPTPTLCWPPGHCK